MHQDDYYIEIHNKTYVSKFCKNDLQFREPENILSYTSHMTPRTARWRFKIFKSIESGL